jgi:hypothetical protein
MQSAIFVEKIGVVAWVPALANISVFSLPLIPHYSGPRQYLLTSR